MPWAMNMYVNSAEEFERILGINDSQILASNSECSIFTHGDREFSERSVLEKKILNSYIQPFQHQVYPLILQQQGVCPM